MKLFIFIKCLLLVLSSAYAQESVHNIESNKKHIHGLHKECPLPKNQNDIVSCALEFHPAIVKGSLKVESSEGLMEKAAQIPNPTLTSRYVKGDQDGDEVTELEANLSFTLEIGGKRGARKDLALAYKENAIANNDVTKAKVKQITILNMHRLRQVFEEKKQLGQVVSAFSKVIRQLKSLPRLSAEQEASLTLFKIALEETKINESELYEEERELEHYFHIATGHSIDEIKNLLPKSPTKWPVIAKDSGAKKSPEVKKLKSFAQISQQVLEVEKAKSWPDLKIGPSLGVDKVGSDENQMVGLNIQIPIPLFQTNGGGRAYARQELSRAKKNMEITIAEENHERFEQQRVYESAVRTLNNSIKQKDLEKKHKRIESLYLRGVVSSSAFLESLRQKLNYTKRRNDRELTALRALWRVHNFDGKVFEEKI